MAITAAVVAAWLGYRHFFPAIEFSEATSAPSAKLQAPLSSDQPQARTSISAIETFSPDASSQEPVIAVEQGPIRLRDESAHCGVAFRHTDGSSGHRHIVETVASGLATFDYDGDGLVDIYFVNGSPLNGIEATPMPRNRLYRNLGQLRFVDVTDEAGVGDTGYGLGVTVGDYNEDALPDIYVSNYGRNVMYRNNGDGAFTEVSLEAGVAADDPQKVGAGPAFLDADADGDLDLFVANYMKYARDMRVTHMWRGAHIYPGPQRFPFYPSALYRNEGDGRFTEVSHEALVPSREGHGMGVICADVDGDGDTDIFVNNDGSPGNFLFRNDGTGKFAEVAVESGTAVSAEGLVLGSMGVDCGDYDNDGLLDFYVTAYQSQQSRLFRNLGSGLFEDVTRKTGAGAGTYNRVTWGCGLVDLDNDGRKDIFLACGHLIDNVHLVDDSTTYAQTPIVLRNTEEGRFIDVSAASGDALRQALVGRGAAFDDLDNDGDLDAVILNSRSDATLLANDSPNDNHWLAVQLVGTSGARDAVGARVKVVAGDLTQLSEVHRGRGYQSHFGSRLHFGLAQHSRADRIEVQWLGGETEALENVPADQMVTVIQGGGKIRQGAAED